MSSLLSNTSSTKTNFWKQKTEQEQNSRSSILERPFWRDALPSLFRDLVSQCWGWRSLKSKALPMDLLAQLSPGPSSFALHRCPTAQQRARPWQSPWLWPFGVLQLIGWHLKLLWRVLKCPMGAEILAAFSFPWQPTDPQSTLLVRVSGYFRTSFREGSAMGRRTLSNRATSSCVHLGSWAHLGEPWNATLYL